MKKVKMKKKIKSEYFLVLLSIIYFIFCMCIVFVCLLKYGIWLDYTICYEKMILVQLQGCWEVYKILLKQGKI